MAAGKRFIADFHIHSHYSMATSKNLIPEFLEYWAGIKGIDVIGTGDCIHPGWLKELKEKFEPAGNGLFRLKQEYSMDRTGLRNKNMPQEIYFLLTGEISNIYKKNDRVRKVHNLCVFPDFEAVEFTQRKLSKFNIESDGRPILGMDSKFLLEIILESSDKSFLVPAHIWTPWFSVLGSKSGFDSVLECYEDLTQYIFAVETGLSSDPAMNWTCSFLDDFKLISNSDAHSPEKLGREANIFGTSISYRDIYGALKGEGGALPGEEGFLGTIEFFPQEGKYHYDGHRKCNVCWNPHVTLQHEGICPKCGKEVTKGVMYRVAELADRKGEEIFPNKRSFYSITSLPDLLAEIMDKKNSSNKTVRTEYLRLIGSLGSEFKILLFTEIEEIKETGGELLAEGIRRLRSGKVIINEGYDGEYGRIKVFERGETLSFSGTSLFSVQKENDPADSKEAGSSIKFDIREFKALKGRLKSENPVSAITPPKLKLSNEQQLAAEHFDGPCLVLAGPGSGKTRILTERIEFLTSVKGVRPENILAVTFSNKAAQEIRERLSGNEASAGANISTFHAFGLSVLKSHYMVFERPQHFYITDPAEKAEIIRDLSGKDNRKLNKIIIEIERYKQGLAEEIDGDLFRNYNQELGIRGAFDLDDLIYLPVGLFNDYPGVLADYKKLYPWILIDEYQDINAVQFELLMLLSGKVDPNLFAIGDPDQAIYGFRGSDVRYIDKLKNVCPNIKVINLSKSYRCPDPVIQASAQILGKKKELTGKNDNTKIRILGTETEKSEADWIAAQIEKMLGGVRSFSIDSGISDGETYDGTAGFSDFAVLCRTSLMFDPIIKAFADHGIACQVIGTEPFYRSDPFSTIISRLRKIYYHLINTESSALKSIDEIRQMLEKKEDLFNILSLMIKNADFSEEDYRRIKELAVPYGNNYEKFFLDLSMHKGIDEYNEKAEAVSILTLHASKGLEFITVFIAGCEEGIIPFNLFGNKTENELAEEERLLYVGMTRTGKNLYLTYAKKRHIKGRLLNQNKSKLLDKLEKKLLVAGEREKRNKKGDEDQLDLFG